MTKHNIWTVSIIGLVIALLFTPLIVATGFYFPYVTGKVFTFRIISSIIFILWIILILKKPEFLPKKSCILVICGVFVLWLAISNAFGVDPANSFLSNFERMEGWFTHVYLLMYLVVLSSVVRSEYVWSWILNVSVIVANIVALKATFDSELRTQVILGNSTYVAIYVLFNLFFAAFLLYRLIQKKTKEDALKYLGIIYYISSIVLFVYVVFRTQTRGTVLALVFSSMLFLILSTLSYWKNKRVRTMSIILLILAIGGSILFWQNRNTAFVQNNPLLARVATISITEGTGKARLINWSIAVEGIKENPVLGWGQENYTYVFAQKFNPGMYNQEPWFDRTHNMFLDWSIQGGIPAMLLYVSIFIAALIAIFKSKTLTQVEKNILISLLGAYVIHNMFVFDNYSSYLMFFTLLGFIIHHSEKDSLTITINVNEKLKQGIVILIIFAVVILSVFTIWKPMSVAQDLINILTQKDAHKALDMYQDIYKRNTFGTTEAGLRIISDAPKFLQAEDKNITSKYIQTASLFGNDFVNTTDVRRLETYGTYLLQIGDTKAVEVLEKAQMLAPDRQNNLYTLGIAYINAKQIQKAKDVFEHAYEVFPENQKAKNYYGGILMITGDKNYKQYIEGYSYKDAFFISMFIQAKQYGEVIKIREQLKKDNPTDYQNQVSLAVAYYLNKQTQQAVGILREVQKAVPDFKGQGDYLIKEMQAGRNIIK